MSLTDPRPGLLRSLVANFAFARGMAARELRSRNQGAMLGVAWLVARPLVQVGVYVLVVWYVFGARYATNAGAADYLLYVLSGMVAWQVLQRGLEDATSLARDRMDVIKQVIYPIETLPVTSLLASAIAPAVCLALFFAIGAVLGRLSWSLLALPVPIVLLTMLMVGASWVFMIAGVVIKDLREIVAVLLGLMVYFSPVVLSEAMVGPKLWSYIMLNPLSHVIVCFRDVLMGEAHPVSWMVFAVLAVAAFAAGAIVINRTKVLINEYL